MAWNNKSFLYCRFSITSSPYGVYCAWTEAVPKEFLKFNYLALFILQVIGIITINDHFNYFIFNTRSFGLKLELTLMLVQIRSFRNKLI